MAQTNPQAAKSDNVVWIYLSYILGWLFGLIGLAVVKDDERVRFHCAQALVFSVIIFLVFLLSTIFWAIPLIGWLIGALLNIVIFAGFVYSILLAVQAGSGKDPVIPFCGDFARKNLMKLFL